MKYSHTYTYGNITYHYYMTDDMKYHFGHIVEYPTRFNIFSHKSGFICTVKDLYKAILTIESIQSVIMKG